MSHHARPRLVLALLLVGAAHAACDDEPVTASPTDTTIDLVDAVDAVDDMHTTDTTDTTPAPTPTPWEPVFRPDEPALGEPFPDTAAGHAGATAWYVDTLTIPAVVDAKPTCCLSEGIWSRRWTPEAMPAPIDNLYAELADLFIALGFMFQARLEGRLASGDVVYVLEASRDDAFTDAEPFAVSWLPASIAATSSVSDAASGAGELVADDTTGVVFDPVVEVESGVWRGLADDVALPVHLPLGRFNIELPVRSPVLELRTSADSSDALTGFVHGHLRRDDVVAALNAAVAADPDCDCLALPEGEPVFTLVDGGTAIATSCGQSVIAPCSANQQCALLIDHDPPFGDAPFAECSIYADSFDANADLDLDGDCAHLPANERDNVCNEAATVALELHAVPTTLVTPESP